MKKEFCHLSEEVHRFSFDIVFTQLKDYLTDLSFMEVRSHDTPHDTLHNTPHDTLHKSTQRLYLTDLLSMKVISHNTSIYPPKMIFFKSDATTLISFSMLQLTHILFGGRLGTLNNLNRSLNEMSVVH